MSRPGYVPTATGARPGLNRLFVLWQDQAQLEAVDATEPDHRRLLLPEDRHPVTLASGVRLPSCHVHAGRHVVLVDARGRPREPADQPTLVRVLLAESAALRELRGATPEEFVDRVGDPAVREAVRRLWRAEGRVAIRPRLTGPPAPGEPGRRP